MKKFFSFILVFVFIVPLTFALVGCNNEKITDLKSFCNQVKDKNFEIDFNANGTLSNEAKKYTNNGTDTFVLTSSTSSDDNVNINFSDDCISVNIPNKTKAKFYENQELIDNKDEPLSATYVDKNYKQPGFYNLFKSTKKGSLYNTFFTVVSNLKNTTVNFVIDNKTNEFTIILNIDLKTTINNVYSAVLQNRNKTINELLNACFNCIFTKEINVLSYVEKFENIYTDNLTVDDLIKNISQETGLNFDGFLKLLVDFANFSTYSEFITDQPSTSDSIPNCKIDNDMFDFIFLQKYTKKETIDSVKEKIVNYETFKQTKISSFVDESKLTENQTKKDYIVNFLNNVFNTLDYSLDSLNSTNGVLNSLYEGIITLISNTTYSKFDFISTFVFSKDLNTKSLSLTIDGDVRTITDKQKNIVDSEKNCIKLDLAFDYSKKSQTINFDTQNCSSTVSIVLDKSKIDLTKPSFGITLNDLIIPMDSFSITGRMDPDNNLVDVSTFISYNQTTKNFVIDSKLVNDAIANNYESILFRKNNNNKHIEVVLIIK